MAYNTQYEAVFHNELEQEVRISIAQKDSSPVTPEPFIIANFVELNDSTDENTIIARELTFTIFADDDTTITWETFLAGSYDEWKVTVTVDGQSFFIGFLTPEEGNAAFLPKPYDIKLRATNGLKLLKDVALTDLSGNNFKGKFTALQYIAASLKKTLLDLPIRAYGSIYNADMNDRGDDPTAHWLTQVKFDHRSFLKDATTFISCYDVLVMILGRHSRLFFWEGKWMIFYMPEHQYAPGGLWYTDYDASGTGIGWDTETTSPAAVGSQELIYPINEDALVSSSFPIKFAKSVFNYVVFPEIPLNNKFGRGTLIGSGTDPEGNPYKDFSIDDWVSGNWLSTIGEFNALPTITNPNPDPWYRRSTFDIYDVELRREVVLERGAAAGKRFIQSSVDYVNQGDRLRINFDIRHSEDQAAVPGQITIYIIDDVTGTKYMLLRLSVDDNPRWVEADEGMVGVLTPLEPDSSKYQNISIESPEIPVSGEMYIMLWTGDFLATDLLTYYKGFSIEYVPYLAGGYVPVTADYWQHTQNANQLDKDEADIRISDTIIRVLKGCMFNMDGVTATTPTWYRYGAPPEELDFKELANLGRYNLGYRRFWRIEGTFTGITYALVDDPLTQRTLSYHKNYRFTDLAEPRDFILVPPLRIDLCTGEIKAVLEEVYKTSADGTQNGDTQEFNYIFSNT